MEQTECWLSVLYLIYFPPISFSNWPSEILSICSMFLSCYKIDIILPVTNIPINMKSRETSLWMFCYAFVSFDYSSTLPDDGLGVDPK